MGARCQRLPANRIIGRSQVFPGNAAEAKTLAEMVRALAPQARETPPTVVLDAGIATEENIAWLNEQGYRYVVVSRRRHRQFDADDACLIKEDGPLTIRAQRMVNDDTGEVELYCHSTQREQKERGIAERFAQRFEAELQKLADGLHKPRTVKRYEKVFERIGRLKQKYPRAARYYEISVEQDEAGPNAKAIRWQRVTPVDDTLPGVYCLRSNQTEWDEQTLWQTYVTLTDLESVFRSLKSELGLRPVYHHKTDRVSGHLFISVLAYHLVHTIRLQLKACGIHLSWDGIRRELDGQNRVTVELKREDGRTVHVRKATRAEPRQQLIYDALGITDRPGRQHITVV
jgi:transposase